MTNKSKRKFLFNSAIKESIDVAVGFYKNFELIVENSNEIFWVIDLSDGAKISYISPAFKKIWGYSPDKLYGNQELWIKSVVPEDQPRIIAAYRKLISGKSNFDETWRIKPAPTSPVKWIRGVGKIVRSQDGKLLIAVGTCEDITAFKNEEEHLRYFKSVVDVLGTAIITKDLDGKVITWNKAAEEMYGYRASEIIGKSIKTLMPKGVNDVGDLLKKVRAGLRVLDYRTIRRRKDGKIINVSLSITPLKSNGGRALGAAVIAVDLNRLKFAK